MATIQKFEDPEIRKKARSLSQKVYPLTFKEPIAQDFRIKDQTAGSLDLIMDNIAESIERDSLFEFINSPTISNGEKSGLTSRLYRCPDNKYFT